MDLLAGDLRFALRRLRATPGFTLVAVLSLALGIGANTAIFSIVNAVLLRPLPVERPDRLVEIYTSERNGVQATSSYPDFVELRDGTREVFDGVVGYQLFLGQAGVPGSERPAMVMGEVVSHDYFQVLGVEPALGRAFTPEEESAGAASVAVLSHDYWQRSWGGDRGVLGRTVEVNRRPFTVVGVAPPSFKGMTRGLVPDLFAPYGAVETLLPMETKRTDSRGSRSMFLKGRLAEGVTVARAGAAVATVGSRLAAAYPATNEGRAMSVLPTEDVAFHPAVDRALVPVAGLLLAVVGLVLLVACTNLASFLLARAADRRREIAIRLSLGARRFQLVRQLLVESVALGVAGGAAGVLLALLIIRVLVSFQPPLPVPVNLDIGLDGTVLLFTAGVSVMAGLLFGLLPALQATTPDVTPDLKESAGAVVGGRGRGRVRGALVVAQVALSLVLLVGAGLFLRSLARASTIDPGFDTGAAALLWPNFDMSGLPAEEVRSVQLEIRARLAALPGVTGVTMVDRLPLGASIRTRSLNLDGVTPPAGQDAFEVDYTNVDGAYFPVMDVPIVVGRAFTAVDEADTAADPVVVSQAFVRRFWPEGDPIGRTVWVGQPGGRGATVVGVARDTKVRTLGEAPRPYVYFLGANRDVGSPNFVVRGSGDAAALVAAARRAALEVHPELVIMEAKTMDEHMAIMLFAPRMAALLLGAFGGLALVLAAIGLYGLVSYTVARRTREMGIRMALGADAGQLVRMITAGGAKLALLGCLVGLVLAAGAARLLARFLFGVPAWDPITFLGVPALLGSVALLAAWLPALRASRVDPARALRAD